jgi:hypothetical protein
MAGKGRISGMRLPLIVILNEVKDPAAQPPAHIRLDSSLRSE